MRLFTHALNDELEVMDVMDDTFESLPPKYVVSMEM